jgi:RimJ/RimL family protein N-acetyltransferase
MDSLFTERLELRPVTLPLVTMVLEAGRREDIQTMLGAELPWTWPSRTLVEQVFSASLDAIKADPDTRLWGDRLMITREGPPRVIGSVIFHGRPGPDGICEVAYGVEESSQGKGYGTEALSACIAWALAEPECRVVRATTTDWYRASIRILEKVGMRLAARQPRAGDMLVYEITRDAT